MADYPALGDPQNLGILATAAGLLQASGPSRYPVPFATALGSGAMQGLNTYSAARMENQRLALMKQQEALTGFQAAHLQYQAALQAWFMGGRQGPPPTPPALNMPGAPAMAAQPSPAAGATTQPTPPGMSPATSSLAFGTPDYATQQTQPQSSTDPFGGLPTYAQNAIASQIAFPGTGSIIMQANQPIVNRGYGIGRIGSNGQYIPDLASEGQIQRTEATKAGLETVPVIENGREIPKFKSQLPGFPGASQNAPAAATPTTAPFRNAPSGPYADIPKLETPKGFGMTPYEKGRQTEAASTASEITKANADATKIANERMVYNSQAMSLLDQATTGSGALSIANVKNFLSSRVGIPLETMDKVVAGDANATVSLNKDLLNAATQKAKQAYGSRITQSEVMLQIKQASPNVDMMTGAIRYLLKTDSAMAQYQIDKTNYLGGYLRNGGDPYAFEGFYAKKFPQQASVLNIHLGGESKANRPPLSSFQK